MAEPQIRYARTADGSRIAWYTIGDGEPFVWGSSPIGSGLSDQWRLRELRAVFEQIASAARYVAYDPRGFGLSDRNVTDFSLDAMVRDLEAVADAATPAAPFTLQMFGYMGIPALAYAARHPERVRALVLLNGIARSADMSDDWTRLTRLATEDWDSAKALLVRTNQAGYASTQTLSQDEERFDRSVTRQAFLALADSLRNWDASDVLGEIETPVLVLHYGDVSRDFPMEASRRLASDLPYGRFSALVTEGEGASVEQATAAVRRFLSEVLPRAERRSAASRSAAGTTIILFADIAESTALTERMGDAAFRQRARALDDVLRAAIRDAGGTAIEGKLLGDGVLGTFPAASQAIDAALRCAAAGAERGLPLHLGIHAGDVIREENNVFGGAVNIAARISALSAPGEVLVSRTVADLGRTSAGVEFEDRGEQALKGIASPVQVYAAIRSER